MELGPQTGNPLAKIEVVGREKRDKIVKVPMSPSDYYLLKKADERLGFSNMAKTMRWLVAHFGDLEQAEKLVGAFKKWAADEAELKAMVGTSA